MISICPGLPLLSPERLSVLVMPARHYHHVSSAHLVCVRPNMSMLTICVVVRVRVLSYTCVCVRPVDAARLKLAPHHIAASPSQSCQFLATAAHRLFTLTLSAPFSPPALPATCRNNIYLNVTVPRRRFRGHTDTSAVLSSYHVQLIKTHVALQMVLYICGLYWYIFVRRAADSASVLMLQFVVLLNCVIKHERLHLGWFYRGAKKLYQTYCKIRLIRRPFNTLISS